MTYLRSKLLLCFVGFVGCISAYSQTFLQIHTADKVEKFPYDKVTEVQFDQDGFFVLAEDGTFPFLYSGIAKIDFGNDDFSGIRIPAKEVNEGTLRLIGQTISSSDGGDITIYNMFGIITANFACSGDISSLPAGIYLAISNGNKLKFVKR